MVESHTERDKNPVLSKARIRILVHSYVIQQHCITNTITQRRMTWGGYYSRWIGNDREGNSIFQCEKLLRFHSAIYEIRTTDNRNTSPKRWLLLLITFHQNAILNRLNKVWVWLPCNFKEEKFTKLFLESSNILGCNNQHVVSTNKEIVLERSQQAMNSHRA